MSFFNKIKIALNIDKVIDSINNWRKDSRKIKIKEQAARYKEAANYAKEEGLDKVSNHLNQKAKIKEESLK